MGVSAQSTPPPDWSRFRGPNGSGVSVARAIPVEFGPRKNLIWRLALPPGHSSPIVSGDRIYLTGFRGDTLVTFAIDRLKGTIIWERQAPAVKTKIVDKRNNPASPSPAVEADGVYVFFPDYGLLAYDAAGKERWRKPLGPFNNVYGMGASPIIVGDLLILVCDQSTGSYVVALDKRTGAERWRTARPEAKSGHSTPIVWRAPDGRDELLIPGSFLLTAYDARTGEKRWWVRGLSFELKSVPVIAGSTLYINGFGSELNEPGQKATAPPASEVFPKHDADKDGRLSRAEAPDARSRSWMGFMDLNGDGSYDREEWEYYRAALESENALLAIRLGGQGDMTSTAVEWRYRRSIPQLPSPVIYQGVLYMVNDNGIVTSVNPETGQPIKQGRFTAALGAHFASPVAADGHIFFTSERGDVIVLPPGGDLEPVAVNALGEDCYATPAFADGRIYIRTAQALYAFGRPPD
jgi:outer membrane protein assembly factor BamB